MSRHWVKQSDDHKGKVDRFCFHSNLAFIVYLIYLGGKDLLYWAQINKNIWLELRFEYKHLRGGSGQIWCDTTESFLAHHPAECVRMEHLVSKHWNKTGPRKAQSPLFCCRISLGKRDKYIYSILYICKISDLLLSEIKEMLTNLLNATFCFLIMHHTGTKASFSRKM